MRHEECIYEQVLVKESEDTKELQAKRAEKGWEIMWKDGFHIDWG